eukprot:TRINITY_DN23295_c0_g1_i3.p2 TRINITY_DN23295_c0_g1~~TRINITY_DN23295_c0_g1_i3.p2  ORF type:complete len:181 (-),score=53.32 TRINITY_DN23295_c0_g1_i3:115-612(-)
MSLITGANLLGVMYMDVGWFIICVFFFFSSRRRHTRCREVSWARRCVQETVIKQREVEEAIYSRKEEHDKIMFNYEQEIESQKQVLDSLRGSITQLQNEYEIEQIRGSYQKNLSFPKKLNYSKVNEILVEEGRPDLLSEFPSNEYFLTQTQQKEDMGIPRASNPF